jgi:hypothetical protein
MQPIEAPEAKSTINRIPAQPQRHQLLALNHPVLPLRKIRNSTIDWGTSLF